MKQRRIILLGAVLSLLAIYAAPAQMKNNFDLTDALVPINEILPGGPPRDGIPALDAPKFVTAKAAGLQDSDRILGLDYHGIAKAYPIAILNWHEIVNDQFGQHPVTVSFCPLCGSGTAYRARAQGKHLRFGVSGLLYNSDMVLYDRQTESLWSQILAQAISGPLKGARLELLPLEHTTWLDWKARHPDTLVLSTDTGHARDYTRSPYTGYDQRADLMFPVKFRAQGYHPKERVIGLEIEGQYKAYPFGELARMPREFNDMLAGRPLIVRFDAQHQSGKVLDKTGKELPSITVFWFA